MSATHEQRHVLGAIRNLVASQMKPDLKIEVSSYMLAPRPGDEYTGVVEFSWGERASRKDSITHDPGIPLHKLTPDRAWPAAQWIVAQIREQRPEWFI